MRPVFITIYKPNQGVVGIDRNPQQVLAYLEGKNIENYSLVWVASGAIGTMPAIANLGVLAQVLESIVAQQEKLNKE